MKILKKSFGIAVTNCYILKGSSGDIVIDPGENAYEWVKINSDNVLAVFNTHGHFDHVYDDYKFKEDGVRIYIHKNDAFMLENDNFSMLKKTCNADVLTANKDEFKVGEFKVIFHHFPGHTPGCCMLEVCQNDEKPVLFSGDFLFKNSIGRYNFPFSSAFDMKESILKVLSFKDDFELFPGHGNSSFLSAEKPNLEHFLNYF